MLFLKERQKKLLKQNSQVGEFYLLDTAFNNELIGTNAPSVSFLCVEKLKKQFQKKFRTWEIFMCFPNIFLKMAHLSNINL